MRTFTTFPIIITEGGCTECFFILVATSPNLLMKILCLLVVAFSTTATSVFVSKPPWINFLAIILILSSPINTTIVSTDLASWRQLTTPSFLFASTCPVTTANDDEYLLCVNGILAYRQRRQKM